MIDLIYTNRISNASNSGVLSVILSDHMMTFFVRKVNILHKLNQKPNKILIQNWHKNNNKSITDKLSTTVLHRNDVNIMCNKFNESLKDIIKVEMSFKSKLFKSKAMPEWINNGILKQIHFKNQFHKKIIFARKSNTSCEQFSREFKIIRNSTNSLVRNKKKQFYCNEVQNCGTNTTKLWKTLKEIVPTKNNKKDNSGQKFSKLHANQLNDHFIEEHIRIVNELHSIPDTNSIQTSRLKNTSIHDKYSIPLMEENNIIKIFNNFKLKKSAGSDELSMRFIKLRIFFIIKFVEYYQYIYK